MVDRLRSWPLSFGAPDRPQDPGVPTVAWMAARTLRAIILLPIAIVVGFAWVLATVAALGWAALRGRDETDPFS